MGRVQPLRLDRPVTLDERSQSSEPLWMLANVKVGDPAFTENSPPTRVSSTSFASPGVVGQSPRSSAIATSR